MQQQLDENKQLTTEYVTDFRKSKYCFWDHHEIEDSKEKIPCPVKYIPCKINKNINNFECIQNISKFARAELEGKIENLSESYYQAQSIFCSYNCCLSFIREEIKKKNCEYEESEMLLNKIYQENTGEIDTVIVPAPHWSLLKRYGGILDIKEFRSFKNKQIIKYSTISYMLTSYKKI